MQPARSTRTVRRGIKLVAWAELEPAGAELPIGFKIRTNSGRLIPLYTLHSTLYILVRADKKRRFWRQPNPAATATRLADGTTRMQAKAEERFRCLCFQSKAVNLDLFV